MEALRLPRGTVIGPPSPPPEADLLRSSPEDSPSDGSADETRPSLFTPWNGSKGLAPAEPIGPEGDLASADAFDPSLDLDFGLSALPDPMQLSNRLYEPTDHNQELLRWVEEGQYPKREAAGSLDSLLERAALRATEARELGPSAFRLFEDAFAFAFVARALGEARVSPDPRGALNRALHCYP